MARDKIPTPRAVLFDWDNTLVNNWATALHAINTVHKHYGFPLFTLEELKNRPARSLRETFPITFGEDWKQAAEMYYKAYRDIHLSLLTPQAYAEELLDLLHRKNLHLGVVSNKLGDNLRIEVKHLGWGKYFQATVGSKDTDYDKPSHIPVELAMTDLQTPLGPHIWFVGDSEVDMTTARNSLLTGIFVGPKNNFVKIKQTHPNIVGFSNLKEIIDFLESDLTILNA